MFRKILYLSILLVECTALSEQDGLLQTDQIETSSFGNQDSPLHTDQIENMKTCPFPFTEDIEPCSCKYNENDQIFLLCHISQDMNEMLLRRLNHAFSCTKNVYVFDVKLNGNKWLSDFSPKSTGQMKITYFNLYDFSSLVGDIQRSAFNASASSLKEVNIGSSESGNRTGIVETGAFAKLQSLRKVSLGNNFGMIRSNAFFDLPNFYQFKMDKNTISVIEEEAFEDLPILKSLDFSNQLISSLPSRSFSNLPNLTHINLGKNLLKQVQGEPFYNLPSLAHLDLSKNEGLMSIGNLLEDRKNPDFVVNLAENKFVVILKDSFEPFLRMVVENDGKGYIDMSHNPLQCNCGLKWLASSSLEWKHIFKNGSCTDGQKLEEVDRTPLAKFCPPDNCPGYDAGSGRMTFSGFNNDEQCSKPYMNLTEEWRKVNYARGGAGSCSLHCDQSGFSSGWYRFFEPAGTKLPIQPPTHFGTNCDTCQTSVSAWLQEGRDPEVGEVMDTQICFAWSGNSCKWKTPGKAVACEDDDYSNFYLYYLNSTPVCDSAYCALSE